MMGRRVMAEPLFYTFRLDDHVPAAHPLRAVDALLDTAFIRRIMAPHYSAIGRPSIDPELMIRMLASSTCWAVSATRHAGRTGCAEAYPRAATPVTSAQTWKAWVRAARYWWAGR